MGSKKKGSTQAAPVKVEEKKQSVLKKMITRSIVGTAMMFFFYAIIITKPFTIIPCFIFALQTVAFHELISVRYKETKEKHLILFRTQCWAWGMIFVVGLYGRGILCYARDSEWISDEIYSLAKHYHLWVTYSLGICAFITFILTLQKGLYKYQFSQLSWTMMTLALLVGNVHVVMHNMSYGLFWFVFPCTLIICNDCMAYFCGIAFGKKFTTRPFIHLSPNKTWEGFVGAFFCTLIFAWLAASFMSNFANLYCPADIIKSGLTTCDRPLVFEPTPHDVPEEITDLFNLVGVELPKVVWIAQMHIHALALASFASLIAPFGGFFASGMKRAFGLKDFGDYFPGHGGVFIVWIANF